MSRGTRRLVQVGPSDQWVGEFPAVICDRCQGWARVRDETDLPRTWAARVGPGAQGVRHYCADCDTAPSVGKGTVPARA